MKSKKQETKKNSKKVSISKEGKIQKNELQLKKNKLKEKLTVQIIQYNHKIERLLQEMSKMIKECSDMEGDNSFLTQRELVSRNKMNIRVINSAIKMIDNNKLQLWMIDDKYLEE